jgi:hypothetical protein
MRPFKNALTVHASLPASTFRVLLGSPKVKATHSDHEEMPLLFDSLQVVKESLQVVAKVHHFLRAPTCSTAVLLFPKSAVIE